MFDPCFLISLLCIMRLLWRNHRCTLEAREGIDDIPVKLYCKYYVCEIMRSISFCRAVPRMVVYNLTSIGLSPQIFRLWP